MKNKTTTVSVVLMVLTAVSLFVSCESYPEFNRYSDASISGSGGFPGGNSNIILPVGGTNNGGTSSGGGNTCGEVDVTFEKQIPTVVLLIDRSGSMWETDFSPHRWGAVRSALFDSNNGVVTSLEDDVQFGLALYNSEGGDAGGECPVMKTTLPVFGAAALTETEFDSWDPSRDTPTGDAIDWIVSDYNFGEVLGPMVIILATDGEPDTCEIPNPNDPIGNPAGRAESIDAVTNAYSSGIDTFVISVGPDVAVDHLQDLANLGRGKSIDTTEDEPVYLATSSQDLNIAFDEIINGVRSCSIELDGEIESGFEDDGTVTIDGNEILKDDPNGYIIPDNKTIEFIGSSCDLIKSGDRNIQVEFPCGGFIPVLTK